MNTLSSYKKFIKVCITVDAKELTEKIFLTYGYYGMDISGVQTTAIAANVGQNDVAGITVLKKAMDIQKESALQLIESIPTPPSDTVGQNINVKV